MAVSSLFLALVYAAAAILGLLVLSVVFAAVKILLRRAWYAVRDRFGR